MASEIRGSDNFDSSNIDPKAIGVGQTWQVVTASRALSTTYTNSTGKPLYIIVRNTGVQDPTWVVGGVSLATSGYTFTNVIVPTGLTYSLTWTGGAIQDWYELR